MQLHPDQHELPPLLEHCLRADGHRLDSECLFVHMYRSLKDGTMQLEFLAIVVSSSH